MEISCAQIRRMKPSCYNPHLIGYGLQGMAPRVLAAGDAGCMQVLDECELLL